MAYLFPDEAEPHGIAWFSEKGNLVAKISGDIKPGYPLNNILEYNGIPGAK